MEQPLDQEHAEQQQLQRSHHTRVGALALENFIILIMRSHRSRRERDCRWTRSCLASCWCW